MNRITVEGFTLFAFKGLIVLNAIEYFAKVITGPVMATFEYPEFQNIILLGIVLQVLSDKAKRNVQQPHHE
ncbi:hypothetical protein [Alteromonas sp. CYL-A6]|uniref:hypothetical protein n=1 Tax=Alteromonas nitratireducens TaxID=3390813 RepID=UPI0034AE3263